MSLDQNLFTLFFTPNASYPAGNVVDLTDASGTVHYRKHRIVSDSQQQVYRMELSDPLSGALLASATAPSATSKHKTVELYNPSKVVELKYTGTLTFRWSFKWETHEFEWKREECFMIRKPDPPVLVAVTKEPPGRIRTASVQILDYNLNRFDVEDRKGLEIVILTALLTFQDSSDVYHEPGSITTNTNPSTTSTTPGVAATALTSHAPKPPPKPAPKKGVERIAELQLGRGQVNEVTVLEEGAVSDYAKHCVQLLQDDAMLFISVRSSDPDKVPKVLQVVEETKRLRHKAGDADLHQYVLHDILNEEMAAQQGPRIIDLNDDKEKRKKNNKEYSPPKSLTVHLSKIDMPELRPRGTPDSRQSARRDQDSGKKKERDSSKHTKKEKATKGKEKEKGKDKDKDKHGKSKQTSAPPRQSTSLPRSPTLHKHRSQPLTTTTVQSSPLPPSRWSGSQPLTSPGVRPTHPYNSPPPALPPRMNMNAPWVPLGRDRPHTMYGNPYAVQEYYMYQGGNEGVSGGTNSHSNGPSTSGLLGRLLGR